MLPSAEYYIIWVVDKHCGADIHDLFDLSPYPWIRPASELRFQNGDGELWANTTISTRTRWDELSEWKRHRRIMSVSFHLYAFVPLDFCRTTLLSMHSIELNKLGVRYNREFINFRKGDLLRLDPRAFQTGTKKLTARLIQTPIQYDAQFQSTIHSVLSDNLSEMPTKPELIALLKTNGIKGYSGKNKAKLEAMVKAIPILTPVVTVAAGVSIKPKEDVIVEMIHSYEETVSNVLIIEQNVIIPAEKVEMSDIHGDIQQIIYDLIVSPMQVYHKWAKKTNQTEHPSSGYAAQHIVSLLINEKGTKSAARGPDIESGSEIKTCSIVGQTDTCKGCKSRVYKTEDKCSTCNSDNIQRNKDSKWLFAVHNKEDIEKLCKSERILLFLEDYPEFDKGNFKKIRLQLFEIYPNTERHKNFRKIIQQYYDDIYSVNKKKGKRPAPKNFWPYKFEFYMCLPLLTFSAIIDNIYTASSTDIRIEKYVGSEVDRTTIVPELMPKKICEKKEGCYTMEEINAMALRPIRIENS